MGAEQANANAIATEQARAEAAEAGLQSSIDNVKNDVFNEFLWEDRKHVVDADIISNNQVIIGVSSGLVGGKGSIQVFIGRLAMFENEDYTINDIGNGELEIEFGPDFQPGGDLSLSEGEIIRIKYLSRC